MTRMEKLKLRKLRKRVGIITLILIFLGLINFKSGFFGHSKSASLTANEMELVDDMVFKSPVIKKLEVDIDKLAEEERIRKAKEEEAKRRELDKDKKIAYLTFDDGPSKNSTPRILDILKENEIEGTFFILGSMAERYPDTLKRVYNEGHGIGHHSYSHNYNYLYSSPDNFMGEIRRTDKIFSNILGDDFETKLLRFPGGEFGKKKNNYANIAKKEGYVSYNWNALNGDSEGHNLSARHLVNRLKSTVGNQKKLIILMHDTDAKATTVQSLQESIDFLREKGYEFRKLPQPVLER